MRKVKFGRVTVGKIPSIAAGILEVDYSKWDKDKKMQNKSKCVRCARVTSILLLGISIGSVELPVAAQENNTATILQKVPVVTTQKAVDPNVPPNNLPTSPKPPVSESVPDKRSEDERAKDDYNTLQDVAKICSDSQIKHKHDLPTARKEAVKRILELKWVKTASVEDDRVLVILKSNTPISLPMGDYDPEHPTE